MITTIHDRYSASTIKPNGCSKCDGMSFYPVKRDTKDIKDKRLWEAKDKEIEIALKVFPHIPDPRTDDFRFVSCPECHPKEKE